MEYISKFKDKKTGEVYYLGPKTWEITLTEEQFGELFNGGVPYEDIDCPDDLLTDIKCGDVAILKIDGDIVVETQSNVGVTETPGTKIVSFNFAIEGVYHTVLLGDLGDGPVLQLFNM